MEHAATRQRTELTGLGRSLFEGAPDPLLLVAPDTDRILEANPRAAQLLARDIDSLTELRFAELIANRRGSSDAHTARRQTTAASLAEACSATQATNSSAATSGTTKQLPTWPTVELRLSDGSSAAVELLISRAEGVEGVAFLIVLRDVTESRRGTEIERLFHDSPVSLWEFDWSRLRQKLDEWSRSGITDVRSWLEENPERVAELARETRIVSVNNGTLRMFGARDLADFRDNLASVFRKDSLDAFRHHVQARLQGQRRVEVKTWLTRCRANDVTSMSSQLRRKAAKTAGSASMYLCWTSPTANVQKCSRRRSGRSSNALSRPSIPAKHFRPSSHKSSVRSPT